MANFVLKFPISHYHGNKGQSQNLFCAPYVEAMFQIWWRSVHKSRHNLGDRCWISDTPNDFVFCL